MLNLAGLLLMLIVFGIILMMAGNSRLPADLKRLLLAGLGLRLVGAVVYYFMFTIVYHESDADHYLVVGARYATRMWQGDFTMFTEQGLHVWGTASIQLLTGITSAIVGTSQVANNLLFSLAAFVGLWSFASAFRRTYPDIPVSRYAKWIWLFPSVWFWTSGAGKEAILLLGIGVAVNGFIGTNRRIHWGLFLSGLTCVFLVRAQVMAVLLFSMVTSQWVMRGRWTAGRIFQGLILVLVAVGLLRFALATMGIEATEDVSVYVEEKALQSAEGNSAVAPLVPSAVTAPFAAFNILFRPLPWDVRGPTAAVSMLEIYGFWLLALRRRRNVWNALKQWRTDRLLATAFVFIIFYSTMLGLVVVNLGIIARQRTCVFPLLFLFFEARPAVRTAAVSQSGQGVEKHELSFGSGDVQLST